MLLSTLNTNGFDYTILKDQEFETLGLMISETQKKMLTFIDDLKYIDEIKNESISMILTTHEIAQKLPTSIGIAICDNPRNTFFKIHNILKDNENYVRKSFKTEIGDECNISKLAHIESNNVKIGNQVVIEEFASIKAGTIIGDYSIIRAGSVIGSSGFEFKRDGNVIVSVEHYGGVSIGNHVEIKCNTVVDKAIYPWDDTFIGDYSKLDNLVYIGHACKIMERVMIPANSVIGGRVRVESDSWIGIGSAIRNGLYIGKNSRVNMGAVVTKDVPDNCSVSGNFAIKHEEFIKKMKANNV